MPRSATDIEAVLRESGPDFDEFSYERPTAGHQGEVFLITLQYGGEEYEIVVKFQTEGDEGFALEPFLHEYVADRTGIPVPRILVYRDEPTVDVPPYFITERVEGKNLAESIEALEFGLRERVVEQAGEILGDMHAEIGFEGFGRLALNESEDRIVVDQFSWDWQQFFNDLVEGYIGRLAGGPFDEVQEAARTHLTENIDVIDSDGVPRLVHDDFRPPNMLFEKASQKPITAVLDWQFALAADPEYHIARTDFLFIDPTFEDAETRQHLREKLYSGYREYREFEPDEGYERRRELYHFATLLWRMASFETAYADFTELERARAQARYRQQFDIMVGSIPTS